MALHTGARQILIEGSGSRQRVARLEDGQLVELHTETDQALQLIGNIYRGRIETVLPSMQAAFVDVGTGENVYLYIDDALPGERKSEKGKPKPNIRDVVQRGEERFVQVYKEGTGSKAPSVTTELAIPGRMLVYLPGGKSISVSRKIGEQAERERLRQIAETLLQEREGMILRTASAGVDAGQIAAELTYLRERWQEALAASKTKKTPCLIYQDADLVIRTIRDSLSEPPAQILIDDLPTLQRVKQFVAAFQPSLLRNIAFYQDKQPLFDRYGIEAEIDKALRRQIWLKSGGSIVIDQTEAMTVIDVNTAKYTGKATQQLEETVTRTNLEAAGEIARQLRLRDIGGIVIIDFIDMKQSANQVRVLETLQTAVSQDRTSTYVLGFTQLGLVEMTRKKSRQNLVEALTQPCPACQGRGRVLSDAEVAQRLMREIRGLAKSAGHEAFIVELTPDAAQQFLREREALHAELSVHIFIKQDRHGHAGHFRITYAGSRAEAELKYGRTHQESLD